MESESLATDDILRLCSDQRRRHLLSILAQSAGPWSRASLADELANDWFEADDGGALDDGAAPDDARRRIETSLHHVHLPKLAAAGVVRDDRSRDRIRPGANLPQVASVLVELRS